jgi:hypothetical protein
MRTISLAVSVLFISLSQPANAQSSPVTETRSHGDMQRAWGWVATAFGSSLLFVGAYSYVRADSLDGATSNRSCDDRFRSDDSSCDSTRWRRMFWLTAPLGAISTATGILLLTTAPRDPERGWRIHATAGSRDVELQLGTAF